MKKDVQLDFSRLLGYRLALACAAHDGADASSHDVFLAKKLGSKIGDKPGVKDSSAIQGKIGSKIGEKIGQKPRVKDGGPALF